MPSEDKTITAISFLLKAIWLFLVMCMAAIVLLKISIIPNYLRGLRDAWRYVHYNKFKSLTPYVLHE
jgi:hypothetical protein